MLADPTVVLYQLVVDVHDLTTCHRRIGAGDLEAAAALPRLQRHAGGKLAAELLDGRCGEGVQEGKSDDGGACRRTITLRVIVEIDPTWLVSHVNSYVGTSFYIIISFL